MSQAPDMPRRLPPGCVEDRDRHGKIRIYYRSKGRPKVRLRGTPWTPEFMAQYDGAKGEPTPAKTEGISPGTWRWLCVRYFSDCADFKRLDARVQRVRRQILEATFEEPIAPGSPKLFRDFPLPRMTPDAIEVLRDRKIQAPESANARLKAIRQVFKFGVKKKLAPSNPTRDTLNTSSQPRPDSLPGRSNTFSSSRHVIQSARRRGLRWHSSCSPDNVAPTLSGSESSTQRAENSRLPNSRDATASPRRLPCRSCQRCSGS